MENSTTMAVEARDIIRRYGDRVALDGFSVSIPPGCVFGLLGPNGSGKSTFISLVAATEEPPAGELRIFGEAPSPRVRARIGTVFQENALDPLMSVGESLHLAARLFGVPSSVVHSRIQELLSVFGLDGREHETTAALSGGMRRRLEMARALMHDPQLLILDEPTTGVDPDERRVLWESLLGSEYRNRTVLLATNDLAEADSVCDQVVFISHGKAVASGTPAELKRGLRREALRVVWDGPTPDELRQLDSWAGDGQVTLDGNLVHITVDDASSFVPRLFELAPHAIRSVSIEPATLEDAYFRHIGRRSQQPSEVSS